MAPFEDNVHISSGELQKLNESVELKCLLKAHLESLEVGLQEECKQPLFFQYALFIYALW